MEATDRLREIKEEMLDLLAEAGQLVKEHNPSDFSSADAYWIPHIKSALGSHSYQTYSPTLQSSIDELDEDCCPECEGDGCEECA